MAAKMRAGIAQPGVSWAPRAGALETLRNLLQNSATSNAIFVSGGASTGKRTIISQALPVGANVTYVDCVLNHTDKLLYSCVSNSGTSNGNTISHACDLLDSITPNTSRIIILYRAERLINRACVNSVSILLRLPELARTQRSANITLILVSRIPWTTFRDALCLHLPPPVCVHLRAYTAPELTEALVALRFEERKVCKGEEEQEGKLGVNEEIAKKLYPGYAALVADMLSEVTLDLREISAVAQTTFADYLAPLRKEHDGDQSAINSQLLNDPMLALKLFNRARESLRNALSTMYRREFVVVNARLVPATAPQTSASSNASEFLPQTHSRAHTCTRPLSHQPRAQSEKLNVPRSLCEQSSTAQALLLAAYLAANNPAKHDKRYFTEERTRRPPRQKRKATERHRQSQSFSLERLLAIYEAIRKYAHQGEQLSQNSFVICTSAQVQLATLVRNGLLVADASSQADPLSDPKFKCHLPLQTAEALAKVLRIDLHQYLHET